MLRIERVFEKESTYLDVGAANVQIDGSITERVGSITIILPCNNKGLSGSHLSAGNWIGNL